MKDRIARYQEGVALSSATISRPPVKTGGEVLVELKDVNVSYYERKVSVSHLDLLIASQYLLRFCKIWIGRFARTKNGTSRDQTVRL
jgi:hypothetical protein